MKAEAGVMEERREGGREGELMYQRLASSSLEQD